MNYFRVLGFFFLFVGPRNATVITTLVASSFIYNSLTQSLESKTATAEVKKKNSLISLPTLVRQEKSQKIRTEPTQFGSMDTHSHLTAPNRSRSSQSPSPSHSASASATSSIHKRKLAAAAATDDHLPPFAPSSLSADTRDGALTSNDDLESISARGADSDSEDAEDSDAVVDDDEDDFENESSMRTFTAARLETIAGTSAAGSGGRNSKIKTENTNVKVENSDKDSGPTGTGAVGPTAVGGSVPGIVVKEDSVKIFTENLQTSGAYSAREESLKREVCYGFCWFVKFSERLCLIVDSLLLLDS